MKKRFNFRVAGVFAPFLLLIGVVRGTAHVTIEGDKIKVRYGFFRYDLPISEVVSAEQITWPLMWGIGLRIGRGLTLGCVADYDGVVRLNFGQSLKLSPLLRPFGIGYRHLALSLEKPDAFLAALNVGHSKQAA